MEQNLCRTSVGTLEIQDASGRRKTVQLDELSAADRALAEQFGYKPVCDIDAFGAVDVTNIL